MTISTLDQIPKNSKEYLNDIQKSLKFLFDTVEMIKKENNGDMIFKVFNDPCNPCYRLVSSFKNYKKIVTNWHKKYPKTPMGFPKIHITSCPE
jgi:hypothetical protein